MDVGNVYKMLSDANDVNKKLSENDVDMNNVIEIMAPYGRENLCSFRDCINYVLIYLDEK
jgi:hypothetical protein